MNSLRLLIGASVAVLIALALCLACRPEAIQRWMLRDADNRLGRWLHVRQRVTSNSYLRRVRAVHIAGAAIGILMLAVLMFSSSK